MYSEIIISIRLVAREIRGIRKELKELKNLMKERK